MFLIWMEKSRLKRGQAEVRKNKEMACGQTQKQLFEERKRQDPEQDDTPPSSLS